MNRPAFEGFQNLGDAKLIRVLWEYRVEYIGADVFTADAILNDQGNHGWELVTVAHSVETPVLVAFFKRPKV